MPITSTRSASSRPQSDYARSAVFAAFRARDAKAIEQGAFVDRQPGQIPRRHIETDAGREVALDHLAAALQLDDDAGPST